MNRQTLIALNVVLFCLAIVAGWFAVNAPQAARPSLVARASLQLPLEHPPTPPGAVLDISQSAAALDRRTLFDAESGGGVEIAALPNDQGAPHLRGLILPIVVAPRLDEAPFNTVGGEHDIFQVALTAPKPNHEQYFGGHLISNETLRSDEETATGVDAVLNEARDPPGLAPQRAQPPRKRPDNASRQVAEPAPAAPETVGPAPAAGDQVAVDEAPPETDRVALEAVDAPADAAMGAGSVEVDPNEPNMILLGVFQSRGAERALVRTTDGPVRVRPGDEIDGWRVASIGEDHIQLRRATQTRMLKMPSDP